VSLSRGHVGCYDGESGGALGSPHRGTGSKPCESFFCDWMIFYLRFIGVFTRKIDLLTTLTTFTTGVGRSGGKDDRKRDD